MSERNLVTYEELDKTLNPDLISIEGVKEALKELKGGYDIEPETNQLVMKLEQ